MPKSKRNKQVDLSKTKKHGLEGKRKLYEEVQSLVDTYAHLFIFSVNDMRNNLLKSVRENWRNSRFLFGKNKVMAKALGSCPEDEYRLNLYKIGERLKGQCGLFFTNQPIDEVVKYFKSFSQGDYARSGNRATETVSLKEGPLTQFPHNLEPYLRQLGLPTSLKKGVVHLVQDHTVCNDGEILTPETAKIVKLLGYKMAEFYIKMECFWSQDGTFTNLITDEESKEITDTVNTLNGSAQALNDVGSMDVDDEMDSDSETASIAVHTKSAHTEQVEATDLMDDVNNNVPEEVETPVLVNVTSKVMPDEDNKESIEDKEVAGVDGTEKNEVSDGEEEVSDSEEEEVPELVKDTIEDDSGDDGEEVSEEEEIPELVENVSINKAKSDLIQNGKENTLEQEKSAVEENKESALNETNNVKSDSLKRLSLDKSLLQSPVMLEKRPKFSPKMTRSAVKAKKVTQKAEVSKVTKDPNVQKSERETVSGEVKEEKQARGRAHKRHSSGKSPAVRQLRNRSIKVVKK